MSMPQIAGVRPEKPKDIDPDCWDLILKCWDSDPDKRPLVGEIESALRSIYDRVVISLPPGHKRSTRHQSQVFSPFDDYSYFSATGDYGDA